MEGAAAADRAKHVDSCSAKRVDTGPTSSTSFGMTIERPALPRRNDVLIDKGTEATKPCLSPAEMRTLTAPGRLLPAGTAYTAMRIIFPRKLFCWSLSKETKKSIRRTNFNQLAPCCWRKVLRAKPRQALVFDHDGTTGLRRTCPFLREQHALLCGEVFVWTLPQYTRLEHFRYTEDLNIIFIRD